MVRRLNRHRLTEQNYRRNSTWLWMTSCLHKNQ